MTSSLVSPPTNVSQTDIYLANLLTESKQQKPIFNTELIEELRQIASLEVSSQNFPSKKDEEWRFLDLSPLLEYEFKLATAVELTKQDIAPFTLVEAPHSRIVFVNGIFAPNLSDVSALPQGVYVGNLANLPIAHNKKIVKYLNKTTNILTQGGSDVFAALNTAGINDVATIWVNADVAIAQPIQVLFVATSQDAPILIQPRCLVVAEKGAKLQLIEYYGATAQGCSDIAPNQAYLTNSVTEIFLGDNAEVGHTRIQRESGRSFQIAQTAIAQERDSRYTCNEVNLGARLSRHNLQVSQLGEQTYTALNGLTMLSNRQESDTHSVVSLTKPHGVVNQLHKCIVDDYSHSVFNGKIFVPKNAQMTNAAQLNRNLVLSSKARVDTKPELQITADNVKCAHGATVSQLQPDELFYLRSRGLSEDQARNLLLDAFAGEILQRIPVESLRERLGQCVACRTF
jgi:Fe-S cluster assembly protein SufD